jgi:uncharacterized protein YdaU (DUF1376 family)
VNYYSHHIGDYRRDTAHLTLLEHGAYRQLLDMYYLSEEPIPAETDVVFRRLCARTDEEKNAVQTVLKEFFRLENGWVHTRCDKEITEYQSKAERARSNGKLGGRPSKTKVVISGNPEASKTKANHKPRTINQEPEKNPLGADAPKGSDDLLGDNEEDQGGKDGKPAYPADFDHAWSLYPNRFGGNPKRSAFHAWSARLKAGHTAADMIAGVQRYAAHCASDGKVGTKFVMQAATFFGPDDHFLEPWPLKTTAQPQAASKFNFSGQDRSSDQAAMEETMRRYNIQVPADGEIEF